MYVAKTTGTIIYEISRGGVCKVCWRAQAARTTPLLPGSAVFAILNFRLYFPAVTYKGGISGNFVRRTRPYEENRGLSMYFQNLNRNKRGVAWTL